LGVIDGTEVCALSKAGRRLTATRESAVVIVNGVVLLILAAQSVLSHSDQIPISHALSDNGIKSPVTAFYKGESQEKNFPGDGREQGSSTYSPAHVLLGGSGGFLFLQIHFSVVTTPSASDAIKQCG